MTFRSICIAVYVFFYLIFTTPERIRLKKLETRPTHRRLPASHRRMFKKYFDIF